MKTVLVIFLFCCSVLANYDDSIEKIKPQASGVPAGDVMIQRITTAFNWINQIVWFEDKKILISADKNKDTSYIWNYETGKVDSHYFKEIKGEEFIFNIPAKDEIRGIIASDQNIRTLTLSEDRKDYNLSDPVIQLKDKGYSIRVGHCDSTGTLYIISSYNLICDDESTGSILYKVKNKKAEKVEKFITKVDDFVFSLDYKKMFVITDNGKIIAQYDFDMDKGKISNPKRIFNVTEVDEGSGCSMTSIEFDNKGNLWVTTNDGLVMRISHTGNVTKIISMPLDSLTSLTWGGYKNSNLLVASKKACSNKIQAGSLMIITGINSEGVADELVEW